VTGDIHTNGALTGTGWCNGALSACGTVSWTGTGSPTSSTPSATAVTAPSTNLMKYAIYTIRGKSYTATAYSSGTMRDTDATALNAIDMSATNPGRIIVATNPPLAFRLNANLNGTLVINGD